MRLKVVFPNSFIRRANRLARKNPSLVTELRILNKQLAQGLFPGNRLKNVGAHVRKVRLGNYAGGRGKSGGFRVAYHVGSESITLLAVCIKPRCGEVQPTAIRRILRELDLAR